MTYRILSAEIAHETNTFSRLVTDQQAFRDRYFYAGEEALLQRAQANTELAGFVEVAQASDWQLEHLHSAAAGPSGKVTRAAFDWLCDPIVEAASANHYDGILLGLHGAMVTDFCDDGEGEILRRLRGVCGPQIPIAITLDLHANVSEAMCELADIIVSYKTYPHVDMRAAGKHAAGLLQATLRGDIHPQTIRVSCPMLEEVNGGRTDVGPMIERLRLACEWEQRADAHAVSINGGFASADIAAVGPTVLVTGEGDMDVHRAFAAGLADDIWQRRNEVINDYLEVDAAAAIALQFDAREGPLVIADYADNPGAGAYGDATNLLRALLAAGVSNACFGPMVDGATVQAMWKYEPGAIVEIQLGGKIDPARGGGPLALQAELLLKSDGDYTGKGSMIGGLRRSFGPTVVVRVAGIEILVTTLAAQMLDLQQFRSFAIEPTSKSVVALKSMQHFRADFEPIAARVIVCDSGALCTPRYRLLEYRHVPRPIFPLDAELDC
ncbi:MAG TPA: M81 family metallopeptidase [Gammaproteobacteria bacterium]|nr:M81 family metallopeptidase [Gammaproteobacteria bacterium]